MNSLLEGLAGLLAQTFQVGGIAARTHGTGIIRGELFLLNLNFRVVPGDEYGRARFAARHSGTFRAAATFSLGVGYG